MALPAVNLLGNPIPVDVRCMFEGDLQHIRSAVALYIAHGDPMADVVVPGETWQCKIVADRVRNTTKALVFWLIHLHMLGFSLNGTFPMDGFCVNLNGSLRGTRLLFDVLVPLGVGNRTVDLNGLSVFARDELYQDQNFGPVPQEVQDLLDLLSNYPAPVGDYLLLKSHPALEDAMGKSVLFTSMYGLLMALKTRNYNQYQTVIRYIRAAISMPDWVCEGLQNLFLHQLMRFRVKPTGRSQWDILHNTITSFLTNDVNCYAGTIEGCLTVRRNGESHLCQDYCGTAGLGTEEAIRVACAAVTQKIPALRMIGPYPQTFRALQPNLRSPFNPDEASAIADAIVEALRIQSLKPEANAAATAAAVYLAKQSSPGKGGIRISHLPNNAQYLQAIQDYQKQQTKAAAKAAQAVRQQVQGQQLPLMAQNMFSINDISNMFTMMAPRLLCSLHRAMFNVGELQSLESHWEYSEVHLP